tara:strand:- start:2729 stop:3745 length:1017 start_codon:yes stop_codon:yes gene_type:complete
MFLSHSRIASLELLRFLSSISVVIFHYKNILINNRLNLISELPFNKILNLFYTYGYYGVHIFFSISGFIFAYTYLEKNISAKKFFVNRFSRLYPLHFLTLLIIVFFEILDPNFFKNYNEINNIYNDIYHFILQIFFISSWGFENGHSFNTPIWSVSIEIILYIIFFLSMRFLKYYISLIIIFILFALYKIPLFQIKYIEFAVLFFSGVFVYQMINFDKKKLQLIISIFILTISLVGNFKILLFAPSLIMVIILLEKDIPLKIRSTFINLGSITYSTYLIHYPILIFILMMENNFLIFEKVYLNNLFFISFQIFLIFISFGIFRFYEKPINFLIRKRLI